MAYKMTKEEKETNVLWDQPQESVLISGYDPALLRKCDVFAKKHFHCSPGVLIKADRREKTGIGPVAEIFFCRHGVPVAPAHIGGHVQSLRGVIVVHMQGGETAAFIIAYLRYLCSFMDMFIFFLRIPVRGGKWV